jgi:hypothetical protein
MRQMKKTMKHLISVFFLLLVCTLVFTACFDETEEEPFKIDFKYTVNEDGTTCTITGHEITGANSLPDDPNITLTIPSTLGENYTVTAIGDRAFWSCDFLTSVIIPDGVTSIGMEAFALCRSMTSITIPDSVTSIGEAAFDSCYQLTTVTLPQNVVQLGSRAFMGCLNLTSITLPERLVAINPQTFRECIKLESINIPSSVSRIDTHAFYGCDSLTNVTLSEGLRSIGSDAFSYCKGLKTITIPKSLASVTQTAFLGCSNITDVYFLGSETEWEALEITSSALNDAPRYYYSEAQPSVEGNYWHYVDGVPTKW